MMSDLGYNTACTTLGEHQTLRIDVMHVKHFVLLLGLPVQSKFEREKRLNTWWLVFGAVKMVVRFAVWPPQGC